MGYFYFAGFLLAIFAVGYLVWYVMKSFLKAYRESKIANKMLRFFAAAAIALLKGIMTNNGTSVD